MDKRIIKAKLDQIHCRMTQSRWPIVGWEARTADHLAPGVYAYDGEWAEIGAGATPDCLLQAAAGKTLFIRNTVAPVAGAPIEELRLLFEIDQLEGLLRVDGRAYAGIDGNHTSVALPAAATLNVEVEFICVPRSLSHPELKSERATLRGVSVVRVSPDVEALWYDLWFLWDASQHSETERRSRLLGSVLEEALLAIDLTAPADEFARDVALVRSQLQERVAAIGVDPEGGRVFLTGHSHIDTAWLWPLRETVRKVGRTWSTACRLMERFPDYHFSCSQPQLYAYAREHYPELYEDVRRWIKSGRWECTGGMWVESDCNVPSGESLIRQILYGVELFREEFGVRPRTCWLPDVFGYPASLPGILKGCGIDYFMTNKLHWQAQNPFPMHLFWWEGVDGGRVLASISRTAHYYNGWPNPEQLRFAWDNYKQKDTYGEVLFAFGYGDGGGGPTEQMLQFAERAKRFPGVPNCRQGVEESYFDDVRAADAYLPVWVGELYLETHRGTYTTQGRTKRANRKSEILLREAEIFNTLAGQGIAGHGDARIDQDILKPAWLNLLLLQFHDILPGSSIGQVYDEAAVDYANIMATAAHVRDGALSRLASNSDADSLLVFNGLSWERSDIVVATVPAGQFPDGGRNLALAASDGEMIPLQVLERDDQAVTITFCPRSVPSIGFETLRFTPASGDAHTSLSVSERCLENRFFRVELDPDGTISHIFDKRVNREILPDGTRANVLQLFQDGPEGEAAWNVHATFEKREYQWDDDIEISVQETGPVRASVRVVRRYRDSVLVQDIVLFDAIPRIDFVTCVEWQARQMLLKAAFPVDIRSARATYEVQFGAVERSTHTNTSWDVSRFEVCAHRWADLSEAGYGVSLLNDCKYGYDTRGNTLRLTLLRGAEWPDPDADRGAHEFTYSLFPHSGDWIVGETVRQAWELNVPMLCVPGGGGDGTSAARRSFFSVDGPAVIESLKQAENGDGWIVRLYEPHGGRGRVRVTTPIPDLRVAACNHVEEDNSPICSDGAGFDFDIKPFEVRTFRLRGA